MITTDPEKCVRISVEAESRDLVHFTEDFLILVLPLPSKTKTKDFDQHWKRPFLEWLQKGRSVQMAADLAGISRRQVYRHRNSDELFRKAWDLVMRNR